MNPAEPGDWPDSELERGHAVSGGRFDGDDPGDEEPNVAAEMGLEAVTAYLKQRGLEAEHTIVLVRTLRRGEERNGGTAMTVAREEDATPAGMLAILCAHAQAVAQAGGIDLRFTVELPDG